MHILETHHLGKKFGGVQAVADLSLAFEKGKITSVVGPNGSGKTTLVNILSGMIPFDRGAVVISGIARSEIRPLAAPSLGLTRTFQEVRIFEQMSVLDNVLIALGVRSPWQALFERAEKAHAGKAEEVLRHVGLWEKRDAHGNALSYGERKLLEIGRAIAMDADIIMLDEPFAGLFKEMVKTIADIVRELKASGKTVILVEHNMDLIRELSDHLIVMDAGMLLAEGEPHEVLARKDVIDAYLGE